MKLFRQKDELFEIMAKAAGRRRAGGSGSSSPIGTPVEGTTASSGRTGETKVVPRPSTSAASAASATSARTTTSRVPWPPTSGASGGAGPSTSATRRLPIKAPPLFGGRGAPDDDIFEIDGDALIVVEDGWEEETAAIAATSGPGRLFALRTDTAIVGGILGAGLLLSAFLMGRTTTEPAPADTPSIVIEVSRAEPALTAPAPNGPSAPPASAPRGNATSVPASAPQPTGTGSAAPQAGFAPPAPAPAPPAAAGRYEVRVCTTTEEKAAALAQWLNANPRSPLFGRADLQAVVSGGSVKIQGFTQREADVFARVRATSDPTGGSGTFHDAYWVTVR